MPGRRIIKCCVILVAILVFPERGETHKPITSKYTYTEDVFPIFNARCGACHVAGGVAPMSLLTYRDSIPWAESIRAELVAAHMPPWYADAGYGELKEAHRLSPRELDIVLTWATGGTPQGPAKRLPAVALKNEWKMGPPDLALQMPSAFTLPADKMEDTREFVLQAASDVDRWIRAVDLLPGTPAIVRDAAIYTRGLKPATAGQPQSGGMPAAAGFSPRPDLGVWLPGQEPVATPSNTGFRWPAGSDLVLRIHYRKTWKYEGTAVTDRSTVGLYLLNRAPEREVRSVMLASPSIVVEQDAQALALRSESSGSKSDKAVRIEAVRPDGARIPMISLTARPDWDRRYWFARPLSLPRGTRINVIGGSAPRLWLDVTN